MQATCYESLVLVHIVHKQEALSFTVISTNFFYLQMSSNLLRSTHIYVTTNVRKPHVT